MGYIKQGSLFCRTDRRFQVNSAKLATV